MLKYDHKQTSVTAHPKSQFTSIWSLSYGSPSPFFEISVTSCYAEWCLRWVPISYVLTSVDRCGTHTASHYQRRDGASSIDHTDLPPCFDFSTTIARTFHDSNHTIITLKSWWWSTFVCTKESKIYTNSIYICTSTAVSIGKINRGSWMQKKGVLPLLDMSMSQEHQRSKGLVQRRWDVVFL